MNKQLLKKVYTFITTAMLFSVSVNAQIVYTDVNPDLTITQSSIGSSVHALDINNDTITDATLAASKTSSANAVLLGTSSGSEALMCCPILQARAINHNVAIGSNPNGTNAYWSNNQNARLRQVPLGGGGPGGPNPIPFGDWSTPADRYLAIRFLVGADWYYGWVRVSVSVGGNSFTIQDYAYNSIPNQPILAGQTMTTAIIENSFVSSINLFPNPADNHLTIDLGNNNKNVQVTIADITGKVIYTTVATDTQRVEVNTKDFSEGIYVVVIQSADFTGTKKLVVVK